MIYYLAYLQATYKIMFKEDNGGNNYEVGNLTDRLHTASILIFHMQLNFTILDPSNNFFFHFLCITSFFFKILHSSRISFHQ